MTELVTSRDDADADTYPRDNQLAADVLNVSFHLAGDVQLMAVQ